MKASRGKGRQIPAFAEAVIVFENNVHQILMYPIEPVHIEFEEDARGAIFLIACSHKDSYDLQKSDLEKRGGPMQKQYSIAEAKDNLPSIIHQVEQGPSVKLTRRGKPVVVLLSMSEFERLTFSNAGFWNSLMSFQQLIHEGKSAFSDQDFEGLRDSSSGREVEWDE